jgi:hypothetical protein
MPTPLALSEEDIDVLHRLAAPIAWGQRQLFSAGCDRRACFVSAARPRRRLSDRARDPTELHARRAERDRDRRRASPSGRARIGPSLIKALCVTGLQSAVLRNERSRLPSASKGWVVPSICRERA